MAYVIIDACIKDSLCVEVCPTDCIHPKQDEPGFEAATQIHALEDVPDDKKEFVEKNAAYYAK